MRGRTVVGVLLMLTGGALLVLLPMAAVEDGPEVGLALLAGSAMLLGAGWWMRRQSGSG